jgi:hypothetical protein
MKERFAMSMNLRPTLWPLLLVLISSAGHGGEAPEPTREVMHDRYLRFWDYVVGASLEAHWLADGSSFWFAVVAPELYKVGVALVPAHPTGWIHEPYLGPPDKNGELYEYAKNETHLDRMAGKLLFVTGTSDFWYSDLIRLLEAFVRADKPYDLLVLPERHHNLGEGVPGDPAPGYIWNAMVGNFQEHLQP